MSDPVRVQLRRTRGWRKPANTIVVSRPSRWGNPYSVAEYGRVEAVRRYITHLGEHPELTRDIRQLRGQNLACWCPLDAVCHADILLELANDPPPATPTNAPGALLLPHEGAWRR